MFYKNYLKSVVLQNQIYFSNVDKYTSRLLLMKVGDIIKVEVSNFRERTCWSAIDWGLHCA